jgi:hypothetical protein
MNSLTPAHRQTSTLNMQDLLILHSNNIYPQNNKDDFKAYTQIDFTQAFPQAKLKEDIYLRFPAGFEHKNEKWALKLKRNLYGLVQASRNWFLKLSAIY